MACSHAVKRVSVKPLNVTSGSLFCGSEGRRRCHIGTALMASGRIELAHDCAARGQHKLGGIDDGSC